MEEKRKRHLFYGNRKSPPCHVPSRCFECKVRRVKFECRRGWRETTDCRPSQDKPIAITHDDDRARLCAPCFRLGIAAGITLTQVHRALRTPFLLFLLTARQAYSMEISTFSRENRDTTASILYNFFII